MAATAGQVPTPGCSRCSPCCSSSSSYPTAHMCVYKRALKHVLGSCWVPFLGSCICRGTSRFASSGSGSRLWSATRTRVLTQMCALGGSFAALMTLGGVPPCPPCPLQLSLDRLSSHMRVYFVINACRLPPAAACCAAAPKPDMAREGVRVQLILFVVNDVDSICCVWEGAGRRRGRGTSQGSRNHAGKAN